MEREFNDTEVKQLIAEAMAPLVARIAKLEVENTALKTEIARLQKNSSNSSKPPSSDIVKPAKDRPTGKNKRKRGGQAGHPQHERPEFPPEQIDKIWDYTLDRCPDCQGPLEEDDGLPRVVQQVEIVT
jgi:transposase